MEIRLHPAAKAELRQAVEWYVREASKQIAAGLVDDFDHLQSLIREHPHIGALGKPGVRKLVFKRFPYTLVYRLRGEIAQVLAVAHHSRYPEYWTGRL